MKKKELNWSGWLFERSFSLFEQDILVHIAYAELKMVGVSLSSEEMPVQ